ncbi:TIGR04283 family arsenosugar biosynthesis glycosyltransferase [Psychroserpens sp. Hel_I_66]|uniref:TIGR04283 family arsenosugar biosynthesis glycosyltransferase n=1 Tax=Psychroserpens sp. Hel_I_66 TaxID=1250004 RepID=UPI0006464205|nr:TIGR04283 family arsenosugar biosynthesis glycosyltransferase [Psychroserpens sp. Hel_I_66]
MISIVIPILNESETIGKLITHLLENSSSKNVSQIIVVDGGSTDGSQNILNKIITKNAVEFSPNQDLNGDTLVVSKPPKTKTQTAIRLISSEKGRAKQLNKGAKNAFGDILYFLHADSFPPKNFDALIISEVKKGNKAGCFRMQFDSNHWWLRLASWLTQFSWRACRGGDQSQFITRDLFDEIGGYDENYIIYEDNILINELFARKQFVVINKKLKTSARLYRRHGVWKLQYHFWTIYVKKWFGATADELLAYYKKHIC